MTRASDDHWLTGDAYEAYMGRWSRALAPVFLEWLQPKPRGHWLEVGCGTGALTTAIAELGEPASVVACDPSASFVEYAKSRLEADHASFVVAGADALPSRAGGFDAVVSGLVLNFLPDPAQAVTAFRVRLRREGIAAAFVWDYAEGMEFVRCFWEEAVGLDPRAATFNEALRFSLCQPDRLASLFRSAGLAQVETGAIEIPTLFEDFEDYWTPFLRGTGPAPSYVSSLDPKMRESLRERLRERLHPRPDGRIELRARAWAVRGANDA